MEAVFCMYLVVVTYGRIATKLTLFEFKTYHAYMILSVGQHMINHRRKPVVMQKFSILKVLFFKICFTTSSLSIFTSKALICVIKHILLSLQTISHK